MAQQCSSALSPPGCRKRKPGLPSRRARISAATAYCYYYSCLCAAAAAAFLGLPPFDSSVSSAEALVLNNNLAHAASAYVCGDIISIASNCRSRSISRSRKRWGRGTTNWVNASWRGFREARRARLPCDADGRSCDAGGSVLSCRGGYGAISSGSMPARGGGDRRPGGSSRVVVAMMGSGVWDLQDEEEWEFEYEVQRLERRLEKAVEKEDYKGAAKARDKLYRMHMDETSAVLSTNSAFYAAFTAKDADRMASLWLSSNDVMCIHPGDEPVTGHQAVSRSWRSLFSSGDARFSSSVIKPTDIRIRLRGTTAVVQCSEEVTSSGTATQTAQAWLSTIKADMASRAGSGEASTSVSPGSATAATMGDAVQEQLGAVGDGGGVSAGKKKKKPRYLNVTNIFRKAGGRWMTVHHHASLPPPPQSNKELRSAMGLGGFQLGDGSDGMPRIINLGEQPYSLDSGKIDGKLDEMIEALRSQLPGGGSFSLGSINSPTGRIQPRGMIVMGHGGNDDEEENDDDDDDDEEEREENDRSVEDNVQQRKAWRWSGGIPLTENLTKKTMQALKKLGEDNILGRREQRRLITDVIQHAAGDEASAVEVAYELLLAHKNEDHKDQASLTEFVDQCKILASALFEADRRKKRGG